MTTSVEYVCRSCGETHSGLPAWHFAAPAQALAVPRGERASRVELTEDDCVIDGREFFVKGLLEIPVHEAQESFTWGVWLSLSEASYLRFAELFGNPTRGAGESFFGWLCNSLPDYPETQLLKTHVHVREYPMRPLVELAPTDHPLAVDQREGLTRERAVTMAERLLHAPAG